MLDYLSRRQLPCIISTLGFFLFFPQHLRFLTGNPFLGGGGGSGVGAKREIRTKGKFRFPKGDADGGAAAPAEYNRLNSTAAI
jgi:hypothetical protein